MRRCFVRASVPAAFHAVGRSWASRRRTSRSIFGLAAACVLQLRHPPLERHDTLEGRVPPRLELARDMALGGIDVLVAALGEGRVVPRLLELALNGPANISSTAASA